MAELSRWRRYRAALDVVVQIQRSRLEDLFEEASVAGEAAAEHPMVRRAATELAGAASLVRAVPRGLSREFGALLSIDASVDR